jgi:regulator of protease activity HflC (stomatin/prohibitin superfamily)
MKLELPSSFRAASPARFNLRLPTVTPLQRNVGILIFLLVILCLWPRIFIPIGSGHAGVVWSRLGGGTIMDRTFGEGYQVIWPWDRMEVYDLRLQEHRDTVQVLTSDGLDVTLDVTVRYAPNPNALTVLHQRVGPNYYMTVIWPDIAAAVRHVVREFKPEDLPVVGEAKLGALIDSAARESVHGHWVDLDRVLITRIALPDRVEAQIEEKLAEEQKALTAPYVLQQAELERQRWAIEADGISDFERRSHISMLKWKGLEAMENLAQAPTSKVVVLPMGSDGPQVLVEPGGPGR